MQNPIQWPPLTVDQQAQLQRVLQSINERIVAQGPMPFVDYMNHVLYAPGLGYYAAGSRKFGRAGDFVTAPEISSLFSAALANQCAEVLMALAGGDVLEFGAGSGRMALDMLLQLERLDCLPEHYCIVEVSPELVARQRETLSQRPDLLARVQWLDALPKAFRGFVVANEVLDAMPVELFCYYEDQIHRGLVGQQDGEWQMLWQTQKEDWLPQSLRTLQAEWPQPFVSEFNPLLTSWLHQLAQSLTAGAVVLIDYGFGRAEYYLPERQQGTLMCHYRHIAHSDPLKFPGLQDITAHVDFTAVAEAADAAGLAVSGYTSQANFLLGCGILDCVEACDQQQGLQDSQQLQQLLMPAEMGELFKAMALSKGFDQPLRGFANDQRHRL